MPPPIRPTSIKWKARSMRASEAMGSAAQCIGTIERGCSIFAITRGQFSTVDVIRHILDQIGPSRLTCWTWCIAGYELDTFAWLLATDQITGATLVIDRYGEQRVRPDHELHKHQTQGLVMAKWVDHFGPGSIKVCSNHAKIVTITNGDFKITIHGSANLNKNPRFEQFMISEGDGLFDFCEGVERGLPVLDENYTNAQVVAATGLQSLFTDAELKPFFIDRPKEFCL